MRMPLFLTAIFIVSISCGLAKAADGPIAKLPWLHECLVITYQWDSFVVPGSSHEVVEDPNGNLINVRTGKRCFDLNVGAASGKGLLQAVISRIDGNKIIVCEQYYADVGNLGNNAYVPIMGGRSQIFSADDATDYWCDPAALAAMKSDPGRQIAVTPVQFKTKNGAVNAIKIESFGGAYVNHVYDAKTGLCLYYFSDVDEGLPQNGIPLAAQAAVKVERHTFVDDSRDLKIPWANEPEPEWAKTIQTFQYTGKTVSVGSLPTLPNQDIFTMTVQARGDGWIQLGTKFQAHTQGAPDPMPEEGMLVTSANRYGGLWAGSVALNKLKLNDLIDHDPLTGVDTTVAAMDDKSILIKSANAGGEMCWQYNRNSGCLAGTSFVNSLSKQKIILYLSQKQ